MWGKSYNENLSRASNQSISYLQLLAAADHHQRYGLPRVDPS